jgi:methyl-accepting chemotaxis protein
MKRGIRFKLLFYIGITSLVLYVIVFGYLIFNSRSLSLDLSENVIKQYAWRNANHTKAIINRDLGIAQGMAASVNQYMDQDSSLRETAITHLLNSVLSLDKRYYASWLSLELKNIDSSWTQPYGRKRYTFYQKGDPVIERINLEGDDPGSTYYQLKQSKNEVINDPYDLNKYNYSGDKRNNIFGTSLCVPVIRNGEFIGLVGMDMTLDIFSYITTIKPYETASSFLLSNNGTVVAHENTNYRGKNILEVIPNQSREILDSIRGGIFISRLIHDRKTDKKALLILTPVAYGTSQQPWVIGTIVPRDEITAETDRIFLIAMIFGLCGLIILALVVNVIAKKIASPIVQSSDTLNDLAKGNVVR